MSDPFGLDESQARLPAIPENRWVGRVHRIEMERGVTTQGPRQGSPYLLYTIHGKDGTNHTPPERRAFSSFSRTFGETACNALKQNKDVQIDYKRGFREPTITAIQIIEPEDQQNDDADA